MKKEDLSTIEEDLGGDVHVGGITQDPIGHFSIEVQTDIFKNVPLDHGLLLNGGDRDDLGVDSPGEDFITSNQRQDLTLGLQDIGGKGRAPKNRTRGTSHQVGQGDKEGGGEKHDGSAGKGGQ